MKIKYYDKQIDELLIQDEEQYNNFDQINIGNPIDIYKNEEERDLFRFLIKSSVALIFLSEYFEQKRITLLDYGCGNGQNSRIFAKGLFDSIKGSELLVHTVFLDVSSILLKEAASRSESFKQQYPNFTYELVQINFNNPESIDSFAKDYNSSVDFAFSIKCFHNTTVKINKDISYMISTTLKRGGVFCQQFYIHDSTISLIKNCIKLIIGRKYAHSIPLDIFLADGHLRRHGLEKVYDVRQKNRSKGLIKTNHFYQHALENYYLKL